MIFIAVFVLAWCVASFLTAALYVAVRLLARWVYR